MPSLSSSRIYSDPPLNLETSKGHQIFGQRTETRKLLRYVAHQVVSVFQHGVIITCNDDQKVIDLRK